MQHFFVETSQIDEKTIRIGGGDYTHIKQVLRMSCGEHLCVSDGCGSVYTCVIRGFEDGEVILEIEKKEKTDAELDSKIFLFQGIPKKDKMELIVQKSVELGVNTLIPVLMKRSIPVLDEKKKSDRVKRWQEIANAAAKQSGRGILPKVNEIISFSEAIECAKTLDVVLIPYELDRDMKATARIISSLKCGQTIGIFIGPEGGFEKSELDSVLDIGGKSISLGRRILRTETAAITILSILMMRLEANL
ncbi:MAG: 16S rRNA (uracil(1498)-N(3))-methyltransferase [Lachnospiraceae bacterium]|jgi:16S rRNA (uracil1498-N3)-methyltransferase|nr:16S rRNA (uracil(1498)-N(3))-methyltransferase [Lachnospiraceae bacterium]